MPRGYTEGTREVAATRVSPDVSTFAGDRAGAARALGRAILASEKTAPCEDAWTLRAAALEAMCVDVDPEDCALHGVVEKHLGMACAASPGDDDLAAARAARGARADNAARAVEPDELPAPPPRSTATIAERARRAVVAAADGAALMREGLWRAAYRRYAAAAEDLAALPGPLARAAAAEAQLNAAACLTRLPDRGDGAALAREAERRCTSALDLDDTRVEGFLRRAAARTRRGAHADALEDLAAARPFLDDETRRDALDGRAQHYAFLRRTREAPAASPGT